MKKLCLILTVLYAIWANCSAQSLNNAGNLLDSNSSTFESGSSSWTCYDNNAWSIVSESGRNGKCLKLTNTGAVNDYDKQMEYSLSGHTPANRTRYVIKFWAKRNGDAGNGEIKVLLQKNSSSENYPQIWFGGNSISIDKTWKQYEYDLTTDRGDYEVIKINFGNCGEVWIDDIEYGEYSASAPGVTLNKTSASVKKDGTITLIATVTPADAAITWSSSDTSVATVDNGVVTGVAPGSAQITATTVDGGYKASCTVTVTTPLQPLLISNFENTDDISGIIYPSVNYSDRKEHIHIDLIDDPKAGGKCVAISDGNNKHEEYSIINIPDAAKDYSFLAFDVYYPGGLTDA